MVLGAYASQFLRVPSTAFAVFASVVIVVEDELFFAVAVPAASCEIDHFVVS
jgi:hypothetical protein